MRKGVIKRFPIQKPEDIGFVEIDMPKNIRILSIQVFDSIPSIYGMFDIEEKDNTEKRLFTIVSTGEPFPMETMNYIGSYIEYKGFFVLHVFEITNLEEWKKLNQIS